MSCEPPVTPVSKSKCQRTAPNAHETFIVKRDKRVRGEEYGSKTIWRSSRIQRDPFLIKDN